jgi:cytochrome P450
MAQEKPDYDPVSVSTLEFWRRTPAGRDENLSILRNERPISWQRPAEGSMMPQAADGGYWAVTSHAGVVEVSKRPEDFCSGRGIQMEDVPEDLAEAASSFLALDAPRHTKLRRLVASAFTPRRVKLIEDQIRDQARRIVDDLLVTGDCDFVDEVARKLPMWTIYEMCGLPEEDRLPAAQGADAFVSWSDEEILAGRHPAEYMTEAIISLINIGLGLAESRREDPRDDLFTNLVKAEVDGEQLTDEEIAAFFVLLSVAGNDTTRNTIARGLKAFTDFPDQRKILLEDWDANIGSAVEEMVRWASPVTTFRRTATRDTELMGKQIREGDWVVMFYASANRDERVFTDPMRFDVQRNPNVHVGFGGGGPHFCMGNMLAKTQLRAIFYELLHRAPNLQAGEPEQLVSNFLDVVKHMPCTLNLA